MFVTFTDVSVSSIAILLEEYRSFCTQHIQMENELELQHWQMENELDLQQAKGYKTGEITRNGYWDE